MERPHDYAKFNPTTVNPTETATPPTVSAFTGPNQFYEYYAEYMDLVNKLRTVKRVIFIESVGTVVSKLLEILSTLQPQVPFYVVFVSPIAFAVQPPWAIIYNPSRIKQTSRFAMIGTVVESVNVILTPDTHFMLISNSRTFKDYTNYLNSIGRLCAFNTDVTPTIINEFLTIGVTAGDMESKLLMIKNGIFSKDLQDVLRRVMNKEINAGRYTLTAFARLYNVDEALTRKWLRNIKTSSQLPKIVLELIKNGEIVTDELDLSQIYDIDEYIRSIMQE